MTQIKLKTGDAKKGYSVLLRSGTVVYTGERDVYIVPEDSIKKLEKEKVDFQIVGNDNGKHEDSK